MTDPDAGNAPNFNVRLSLDGAAMSLVDANPPELRLPAMDRWLIVTAGWFAGDINAALATGVQIVPDALNFGPLSLQVYSNDAGNTGLGGPLSDTDYLSVILLRPANVAPYVVSVTANSRQWSPDFRDYVDGQFGDRQAAGYRIPYGPSQLVSLPWVNVINSRLRSVKTWVNRSTSRTLPLYLRLAYRLGGARRRSGRACWG